MFSVIIPLYNKAPFIQRAIDSVLNQTFQDFEIIVIDDGSTDGSGELLVSSYCTELNYIYQANQGVSAARNRGVKEAKFPYIAFLDADDYWHPDYLFWMKAVLDRFPDAGLLGSSYSNLELPIKIVNPTILEIEDYFTKAVDNTLFTSSSTVVRADFFENKEGFKTYLTIGEDIDLWIRTFDYYQKAYYLQTPLMYYDLSASDSIRLSPDLKETIFKEIFTADYAIATLDGSWLTFRDKYLTLNLFQYFDSPANFAMGQQLLKQRANSYPLASIPYFLPFSFYKWALKHSTVKKLIRIYFKFCFRYLYN